MTAAPRLSWRWAALGLAWLALVIALGTTHLPTTLFAAGGLFLLPVPPVAAALLPALGGLLLLAPGFGDEGPLPTWLALAMLLVGSATSCVAAMAAVRAATLTDLVAWLGRSVAGLALAALGLCFTARALDLPEAAGFALGAALLALVLRGVAGLALLAVLAVIRRGAGTLALARLGGLGARMGVASLCLLAGGLSFVPLPPGPGFAIAAGLAQALVGIARAGLPEITIASLLAAALLGVAGGYGLVALARGLAIAVLGRPRTPRAAAAEATAVQAQLGRAMLALLLALWLAPILPAWLPGIGATLPTVAQAAPLIGVGLALLTWCASLALRRFGAGSAALDPAWEGGFAAPPPWLPFGEPATQATLALADALPAPRWPPTALPKWPLLRWRRLGRSAGGFGLGGALATWLLAVALLAFAA